eukprot:GHVS01081901.1.p1 GENE.GHVS01081901.1~~GHVS01081901.1.p1  ORF type:complete len:222 (+),score=23.36 GHVS01081901.1:288-953(+)
MALMHDTPRAATVVAMERVEMMVLKRQDYRNLAMARHMMICTANVEFLRNLPCLTDCNDTELRAVADKITVRRYPGPEVIVKQGEEGNNLIVVHSGTVIGVRAVPVDSNCQVLWEAPDPRKEATAFAYDAVSCPTGTARGRGSSRNRVATIADMSGARASKRISIFNAREDLRTSRQPNAAVTCLPSDEEGSADTSRKPAGGNVQEIFGLWRERDHVERPL